MAELERRAFGKTGLEVSVLGFGGAPIGVLETEQQRVEEVLNLILDEGVNLIDTAANYRGSEEAIGKAVSARRSEFVLVTKCGQAFDDLSGEAWSSEVITGTIERSLRRLKTDYLDVVLLHTCDLDTLKQSEAVEALVRARDAGKVRFAGYSGDHDAAAYAASLEDIAVIQTSVNFCDQGNIDSVLPVARQQDVGVMAKRPIANAAWKELDQQPGMYSSYAATYSERFALMGLTPDQLGFDGPSDQVWPEIALRFTLSQLTVHTAIIGTTNTSHVRSNLAAARKGALKAEVLDQLKQAFQEAERRVDQTWLGQT
ncbi:MAG: aldo/keto reductase [Planctomycetota bacterium]|jgi:aryl-alcohol dehydrogenase-like predicted oxidoreductase|nr:aldo/keto reductase [Planctomycetota bacterium]